MRTTLLAVLVALVSCTPRPTQTATASQDTATAPQPSDLELAGIRVGADSASVLQVLGVPDSSGQGDDPSLAAPLSAVFYPGVEVVFLAGKVHGVWLKGSGHATSRGLKLGDSIEIARRLYGPSTGGSTTPPGLSWLVTSASDSAMLYVIVDSSRVKALYIGNSID